MKLRNAQALDDFWESGGEPLTMGEFRELTANLPDDALLGTTYEGVIEDTALVYTVEDDGRVWLVVGTY